MVAKYTAYSDDIGIWARVGVCSGNDSCAGISNGDRHSDCDGDGFGGRAGIDEGYSDSDSIVILII